jgi:uncharacterized protein (TIGR02246 family)
MDDDVYAIHVAKTQYEKAFNTGDVAELMSVFSDNFLDLGFSRPTQGGEEARQGIRAQIEQLLAGFRVDLSVTPWFVQLAGDLAYVVGMEIWMLTPKSGDPATRKENRYLEVWRREADGQWRLNAFMDNPNLPPAPV